MRPAGDGVEEDTTKKVDKFWLVGSAHEVCYQVGSYCSDAEDPVGHEEDIVNVLKGCKEISNRIFDWTAAPTEAFGIVTAKTEASLISMSTKKSIAQFIGITTRKVEGKKLLNYDKYLARQRPVEAVGLNGAGNFIRELTERFRNGCKSAADSGILYLDAASVKYAVVESGLQV
ncbi:hypothetical protein HDU88_008340 [Geranomyces variabilis]|nr:hypothetical protein HDU88_008340 [Geranomyces variabilis]